jgi:hypothetical protein
MHCINDWGLILYSFEKKKIKENCYEELAGISFLKAKLIEQWMRERSADLFVLGNSPLFRLVLSTAINDVSESQSKNKVIAHIQKLKQQYNYENIFNRQNNIIASTDSIGITFDSITLRKISFAQTNELTFSDFYYCSTLQSYKNHKSSLKYLKFS